MRQSFFFLTATIFVLLFGGCSQSTTPATPTVQVANGMAITLTTTPTPPHTGDDTLIVTMMDAASHDPIGNANVTATPVMQSPRMRGTNVSGRAQGNGRYEIPVRFAIATRYEISLHIERTGKPPTNVTFPLEAQQ